MPAQSGTDCDQQHYRVNVRRGDGGCNRYDVPLQFRRMDLLTKARGKRRRPMRTRGKAAMMLGVEHLPLSRAGRRG